MFLLKSDEYNCYKKAGTIAKKVKRVARDLIEIDQPIIDIVEKAEKKIIDLGGGLAFPLNISINNIAAHYTPITDDKILLKEDDIVKIDIGIHVNGYIADTAFTVYLGDNPLQTRLREAAKEALSAAIDTVKPGVKVNEIGQEIEKVIVGYGFRPIRNLTGHSLAQWNLHSGITIPNVKQTRGPTLSEDDAVAIEPFATNGEGFVKDSDHGSFF